MTAPRTRKPIPSCSQIALAMADPARHVHIMPDDEVFMPRLHRLPVKADPQALPAGFFRAVEWVLVEDSAPLMMTECPPCAMFAAPRDISEVHS